VGGLRACGERLPQRREGALLGVWTGPRAGRVAQHAVEQTKQPAHRPGPASHRRTPFLFPPPPPAGHFNFGAMLHRTHALLGGGEFALRYLADFWACDSRGADPAACAAANATADPVLAEASPTAPAAQGGGGGDDADRLVAQPWLGPPAGAGGSVSLFSRRRRAARGPGPGRR
jgi:hypothetical protein